MNVPKDKEEAVFWLKHNGRTSKQAAKSLGLELEQHKDLTCIATSVSNTVFLMSKYALTIDGENDPKFHL